MIEAHGPAERYETDEPAGVPGPAATAERRPTASATEATFLHHGFRHGLRPALPRPDDRHDGRHDGRATGTAAQEGPPPMFTATKKRSTIDERPAEAPAPKVPAPETAASPGGHGHSGVHLTHRAKDGFRAPPAHLLLLRDALADRAVGDGGPGTGGRTGQRRVAPCRRVRAQSAGTTQLTLAQWVSRTARIGATADERAATG